jgi:tight adherence protein C
LAAQLPETQKERRDFQLLLRQAGLYSRSARITIYALRFVFLIGPMIAAGVWAVMAPPNQTWKILFGGAMAAAALSVAPRLYVFFRRRGRLRRIRQGLPDTIDMLSMCTSGGLGLSESLDHVASQLDAYPELVQELQILKRQTEVSSLKQALADLCLRVDLPEVRQLCGLLTRGTRLGTQLAGSLNEQADHLRVARRQAATAQANKTPVKLVFPTLFCFAPAALILLIAPAMLELRDFLTPTGQASQGTVFGTGQIIDAIQGLDQNVKTPTVGSDAPTAQPQF